MGDLNGDGAPDIVMTAKGADLLSVFINVGDGTFSERVDVDTGSEPEGLAVFDADGDGDLDVAAVMYRASRVQLFVNDGIGGLAYSGFVATGASPWGLANGDMDGDGDQDLVVSDIGGENVRILLNDGAGNYALLPNSIAPVGDNPYSVSLVDVNGDGLLDVLTDAGAGPQRIGVNFGLGSGVISAVQHFGGGGGTSHSVAGDLDGDGQVDLVVTSSAAHDVFWYYRTCGE